MEYVMGLGIWAAVGAVSFELVRTGHWIIGTVLIIVLMASTTIKSQQ
jgi:uncharacterized membrane protein YgaE (UPF0421/DUF939 family)